MGVIMGTAHKMYPERMNKYEERLDAAFQYGCCIYCGRGASKRRAFDWRNLISFDCLPRIASSSPFLECVRQVMMIAEARIRESSNAESLALKKSSSTRRTLSQIPPEGLLYIPDESTLTMERLNL